MGKSRSTRLAKELTREELAEKAGLHAAAQVHLTGILHTHYLSIQFPLLMSPYKIIMNT